MKYLNKKTHLLFSILLLFSFQVGASGISVNPISGYSGEYDGTGIPFSNSDDSVNVQINLTCFHANTRDNPYMLTTRGMINPYIRLTAGDQTVTWTQAINIPIDSFQSYITSPTKYIPSWFAYPNSCYRNPACGRNGTTVSDLSFQCTGAQCPQGAPLIGEAYWGSKARQGIIQLKIPLSAQMSQAMKSGWILNGSQINAALSFSQVYMSLPPILYNQLRYLLGIDLANLGNSSSAYRGYFLYRFLGRSFTPQSNAVNYQLSAAQWDGSNFQQTVAFAGGSCGQYTSPLILYFDDHRPRYSAQIIDSFISEGAPIYWPEKNSRAYFLAFDKDGNKIIDQIDELFGSNGKTTELNGFEVLKHLDENNDGVIDEKDPQFKKLVLWNDNNADGKSASKEIKTLSSMGVSKISLKFETKLIPYGLRAQERQHGTFEFKTKNTLRMGQIIDVWFNEVGGR